MIKIIIARNIFDLSDNDRLTKTLDAGHFARGVALLWQRIKEAVAICHHHHHHNHLHQSNCHYDYHHNFH